MPTDVKQEAEELKKNENIRRALEQTAGNKKHEKPKIEAKHKFWLGTYVLLLIGLAVVYYSLRLRFFGFAIVYIPVLQRLALGLMGIVLVLLISKAVKAYFVNPLEDGVPAIIWRESSICWSESAFSLSFSPFFSPTGTRRLFRWV